MRICSHLLKTFLMKKFIFLHWFEQVNGQKTNVKKKENNLFFSKIMLLLYSQFLKKSLQVANFFTARCLDVRFWDLLNFICLTFNPQHCHLQKQPSRVVGRKRRPENTQQIYRRTPMLKCYFNSVISSFFANLFISHFGMGVLL